MFHVKNGQYSSNTEDSCNEAETIPDEEFTKKKPREKLVSWPSNKRPNGPNINVKFTNKRYSNEEERHFFFEKIKQKKKTELCKNYELYHDCFFKNECSFAHGVSELRQNCSLSRYKNKICKTFTEKSFCNFGIRCNYRHIIKKKRLLKYSYLLKDFAREMESEMSKQENASVKTLTLLKYVLSKRKLIM